MKNKFFSIIFIIAGLFLFLGMSKYLIPEKADTKRSMNAFVRYVIDGDTIILSNGEKVRFLGVDTPESYESEKLDRQAKEMRVSPGYVQELGKKAKFFTEKYIDRREIILKFDKNNEKNNHRDKYGRLLAYVYILGEEKGDFNKANKDLVWVKIDGKDAVFLNASLIKSGNAEVSRFFQYEKKEEFLAIEK